MKKEGHTGNQDFAASSFLHMMQDREAEAVSTRYFGILGEDRKTQEHVKMRTKLKPRFQECNRFRKL